MIAALLLLLACTPTCEQVCRKVLDCGYLGTERMSLRECEESCLAQEKLYDQWNDQSLEDGFNDSLECYQEQSCEALAQGACYDAEIWSYAPESDTGG